ncbi:hypothetical protein N7931_13635 [Catenovulum sp. 2E275]|uniref:hypothetical protein n=1 Tax=Catenovulum sp. 2E275 TaxID=2980497 RepID=UPI0021CE1BFC|nr:hypothetical protein [Catenovulum sp. 2E275]MCU4676674.1 hypothetical protein [Catenovulum sp. 2E275]
MRAFQLFLLIAFSSTISILLTYLYLTISSTPYPKTLAPELTCQQKVNTLLTDFPQLHNSTNELPKEIKIYPDQSNKDTQKVTYTSLPLEDKKQRLLTALSRVNTNDIALLEEQLYYGEQEEKNWIWDYLLDSELMLNTPQLLPILVNFIYDFEQPRHQIRLLKLIPKLQQAYPEYYAQFQQFSTALIDSDNENISLNALIINSDDINLSRHVQNRILKKLDLNKTFSILVNIEAEHVAPDLISAIKAIAADSSAKLSDREKAINLLQTWQ